MKLRKMIAIVLVYVLVQTMVCVPSTSIATAAKKKACYTMTPKLTTATYDYLNEMYIEKYPEMGLEFVYGTDADKKVLNKLLKKVTKGCTTDEEIVTRLYAWYNRNIEYMSYTSGKAEYYPMDVFYERKANCLGYALFMSHMLRLADIPAVMVTGSRGDMKEYVFLDDREQDHAWVMAYYNNDWHLIDPLFEVTGTNDKEFIASWYFVDMIEGVSPYYKGMKMIYVNNGSGVFYIEGKAMLMEEGKPATEIHGTAVERLSAINDTISIMCKTKYADDNGGDGYQYVENPQKREEMVNSQCYYDGWIQIGDLLYCAKPNGLLYANTIKEYNGKTYFLAFDGTAFELPEKSSEYTFTKGFITIKKGEVFDALLPVWVEGQIAQGREIVFSSEDKKIATISKKGKITPKKTGLVAFLISSQDSDGGYYCNSYLELYIAASVPRKADYTDNKCKHTYGKTEIVKASKKQNGKIEKRCTKCGEAKITVIAQIDCVKLSKTSYVYNGKDRKPKVTVYDLKGKIISSKYYKVVYEKNPKKPGVHKVTVKFNGRYKGSITKKYTITKKAS